MAHVEIITAASVNTDGRKIQRIRTVDKPWGEQHGTIGLYVEVGEIEHHIHGHIPAIAFHLEITDSDTVDNSLFRGLGFSHTSHAQ